MKPLYRQGDVLIQQIEQLPDGMTIRKSGVLAEGEVTGHKHRIAIPAAATVWEAADGNLYMHVGATGATIVHDEHGPVAVPEGIYKVWQQREYTPQAIRRVVD